MLDGLDNARDLGGYPARDGSVTRFGVFIRSEFPAFLSEEDVAFIKHYGIRHSLDFRGDDELAHNLSFMSRIDFVGYKQHAMYKNSLADRLGNTKEVYWPTATADWGDAYIDMVELHKDWVWEGLEFAAFCDGGLQFNCATGKDRTGVFAALLLGIADVSEVDIVADYCISQYYLTRVYEAMNFVPPYGGESKSITDPYFLTEAKNMKKLLRYINDRYGGIASYVSDIGVSSNAVAAIREKFIGRQIKEEKLYETDRF